MKNILLITRENIEKKNPSTMLLSKLCNNIENIKLYKYARRASINNYEDKELSLIRESFFFRHTFFRKIIKRIIPLLYWYIIFRVSKKEITGLIQIIKKNKIDKIWFFLESYNIFFVYNVLQVIDLPYHVTLHDDPLSNLTIQKCKRKVYSEFKSIIQNARSLDFVTEEMADYYKSLGINFNDYFLSRSGFHNDCKNFNIQNNQSLKICLAGSYQWTLPTVISFLDFLQVNGFVEKHQISFDIFSKEYVSIFKEYDFVNYLGFINEHDLIRKLSEYDYGYIPMSFDKQKKIIALTSFPSKIKNYCVANLPIIAHSPKLSGLNNFVLKHNIGICIDSLRVNSFDIFVKSKDIRTAYKTNISKILNEVTSDKYYNGYIQYLNK